MVTTTETLQEAGKQPGEDSKDSPQALEAEEQEEQVERSESHTLDESLAELKISDSVEMFGVPMSKVVISQQRTAVHHIGGILWSYPNPQAVLRRLEVHYTADKTLSVDFQSSIYNAVTVILPREMAEEAEDMYCGYILSNVKKRLKLYCWNQADIAREDEAKCIQANRLIRSDFYLQAQNQPEPAFWSRTDFLREVAKNLNKRRARERAEAKAGLTD